MSETTQYEISVTGVLGPRWKDWFPDMAIHVEEGGACVTRLTGLIEDQARLMGVLQTLVNLGLPIRSVRRMESGCTSEPG